MFKYKRWFIPEYDIPLVLFAAKGKGMIKAIPYYRVSTERQGRSGLGLDAQKLAVKEFAIANDYKLLDEFIEIESGKKSDRPVLLEALNTCKAEKAILLIAKLDRLGRNVAFISKLMESGVEFQAVDNPNAETFIVHIMAAVAEYEREQISRRTKAALQMAKARGVELGWNGKHVLSKVNKQNALLFAQKIQPIIIDIQSKGKTTIRAIKDELNRRQIPTDRNNKWHIGTVHGVIKCLKNHK